MDAFLNTYLPWGIIAVTVIICFFQNMIDTARRRESKNPYDQTNTRRLEISIMCGIVIGAVLCYSIIPIPVIWGVAIGGALALILALLKKKK